MEQSDREVRRRIRTELDATLFVEAGAGTGKTTKLVERILQLIVTGRARIEQVAAITFTEAAAAELRDRLAAELDRLDADEARSREALKGIDGAAITTLHGFARRVLSEHPFEAGIPPVVEVLDEIQSQVEFEESWGLFLDRISDQPAGSRALQLALTCEITVAQLREVAKQYFESWDRVPRPESVVAGIHCPDPSPVVEPLRRALALAVHCTAPDDLLFTHLRDKMQPLADRLEHSGGELDALGILVAATKIRSKRGKAPSWGGHKQEVVGLLDDAAQARDEVVRATFLGAMRYLTNEIARLTLEAADARRRDGRLQFHDLLVLARDLVRSSPSARAALHDAYPFMLIDEFQDTDPIQVELAVRIASADLDQEGKDWQDLSVEPGRIFFVGDPKQSIYRFRGADIGLFLETRERFGLDPLQLTTSFRSAPGIVLWVNETFGRLIGTGAPGAQPSYEPLVADPARMRSDQLEERRVVVVGGEAEAGVNVPEVRRREAADIAQAIVRIRDEAWPVGPAERQARLADITVLIPTRSALPELTQALDHSSIPYRLESSSLVYSSDEVRDLLHIVRAVDDPTDEAAVVAALRSPGFGCGDDDLLRFRLSGGSWDYRRRAPSVLGPDHPVVAGQAALTELHAGRRRDVSALIQEILVTRRLFSLTLAMGEVRSREAWRRLRFVLDQARQFTGSSLRHYLAWVNLQTADDARVKEVVLPESDLQAVRIMTVHASKGLEFPIVILAGLGARPRTSRGVEVLFGPDVPELKIVEGRETPGYRELALREKELAEMEQVRLLYVAATRASDFIVLSVHRKAGDALTMAGILARTGVEPAVPLGEVPVHPGADLWPDARAKPEEPDSSDARDEWVESRRRQARSDAVPSTLSATGVAHLIEDEPQGPAWRKGRGGTAVGRAVHAVLQSVDLATGEGIVELARAQAVAEGVTHRAGDIEAMVRSALDSVEVRRAVAGRRYWRELYVGVPVGKRVLEGFVDLLIEGADGLEVIDYKTDQARTDEELGAAMGRYRLQGAAYAVAVEAATTRPVSRCTFLFLSPDGAVARELGDLEVAKAQVSNLVGAV